MCRRNVPDRISQSLLVVELFFSTTAKRPPSLIWNGFLAIDAQLWRRAPVSPLPATCSCSSATVDRYKELKLVDFWVLRSAPSLRSGAADATEGGFDAQGRPSARLATVKKFSSLCDLHHRAPRA